MKVEYFKKVVLLVYFLQFFFFEVISIKNSIKKIITDKVNIRNTDQLKNIFDFNFIEIENKLNSNSTQKLIEQNKNDYKSDKKSIEENRKNLKVFNISLVQNFFKKDISNITKTFNCFYFNTDDFSVYDLSQVDKEEPSEINISRNGAVRFKLCQPASFSSICDNVDTAYLIWKNSNDKICKVLSGNETSLKKSDFFTDSLTNDTGININFPPGEICNASTKEKYQVTFKFICDSTLPLGIISPIYSSSNIDPKNCKNSIEIKSANACSLVNHFPFLKFLQTYKIFTGAVLIIFGIFLLMWGTRFIEVTFVTIVGLIFTQFGLKIYDTMHIENSNPDYIWIVFGVSFLIGVGVGYFAINMITFAKLCMGGYVGYTFSSLVYQFILRYIHTTKPELIYWITVLVCIVIGCILITYLVKQAMIVATSLIGSYAVIKGISLYAGRFPNEQVLFELLKNQEFDQLGEVFSGIVVLYLIGWGILFLGGIFYQCKFFPEDKEDNHYFKQKN